MSTDGNPTFNVTDESNYLALLEKADDAIDALAWNDAVKVDSDIYRAIERLEGLILDEKARAAGLTA